MNTFRKLLIIVGVLLVVLVAAMLIVTTSRTREAEPGVAQFLKTSDTVSVDESRWLTFSPVGQSPKVGFIFYPGASVEAAAYAPTLSRIAEKGFLVVGVPMPLNMAIFGANRASKVIASHPEIETWVIGGHSLGGVMASQFIDQHPGEVDGLALWASYPAESRPLNESDIQVVSIYGTLDGLASVREVEESIPLLPEDAIFIPIAGGNHAQFGYYGPQRGDMSAMISRESQQELLVETMAAFLDGFD
jgi:predicted alpha/beta-hydrolase family hydrolase